MQLEFCLSYSTKEGPVVLKIGKEYIKTETFVSKMFMIAMKMDVECTDGDECRHCKKNAIPSISS